MTRRESGGESGGGYVHAFPVISMPSIIGWPY